MRYKGKKMKNYQYECLQRRVIESKWKLEETRKDIVEQTAYSGAYTLNVVLTSNMSTQKEAMKVLSILSNVIESNYNVSTNVESNYNVSTNV